MSEKPVKIAIYPGSFDPWHEGHSDILKKALKCFDKVIVAVGTNPEKYSPNEVEARVAAATRLIDKKFPMRPIIVEAMNGFLVDYANYHETLVEGEVVVAIIRGLRNGNDLQYEQSQQYWSEDLGLKIPMVYFICDRKLSHISSSAIRYIKKIKKASP